MNRIATGLTTLSKWWFLFLIFSIPFSLRYVVKEPFAISYLNLVSVGFIALAALTVLTGGLTIHIPKNKGFWAVVIVFVAAMLWGMAFTDPPRSGVGLLTSRLFQPLLVGFFGYQLLANRLITIEKMVIALVCSLPPLLVLAGLQLTDVVAQIDPSRLTASYIFPNTFARYAVIVLLISLPWIALRAPRPRFVSFGLWILGVGLLGLSLSYNGAVSFVVGLTAMVLALPKRARTVKWAFLAGLVTVGAFVYFNVTDLPKWEISATTSRLSRLQFWQIALGAIGDNFWTGIGLKGWELEYPELVKRYFTGEFPLNWTSPQPHNVVLDSLLKAGVFGLIGVMAIMIWPLVEGLALVRSNSRRYGWFGLSMLGYASAMLFFGLIDDPLWSDDTIPILFIFTFALAFATTGQTNNDQKV